MKKLISFWLCGAALSGLSACSSSSSSSALNVSGSLNVNNSTSSNVVREKSTRSVDLTQYTVTCVTMSSPVLSGTGNVASNGSFTVSIVGAENKPLSCYLVNNSGNRVADFVITDASKKDLNGNSQTSTSATFTTSANLGTISFDPDMGEVTVPATQIASFVSNTPVATTVFDPTGTWTISALDFTPPGGVKPPCPANDNSCNGPPAGQTIYLQLWKGLVTADNSSIYGLQVWDSPGQFSACGSKIGLTNTIKTDLGIDFSANGGADAPFTFATNIASFADPISSVTGPVNLTNGWQMNTATMLHNQTVECQSRDVTIGATTYANAWVCGPSSSNYQAQLGGGCRRDSDQKVVDVQDWTGLTCGSTTTDTDGVQTVSCSGSKMINSVSTPVTCTNKWAVLDGTYTVIPNGTFNWGGLTPISQGTSCSAISTSDDAHQRAQLQCYAEYYDRSGMREQSGVCLPRVDMDWSASTAADFAKVDSIRPQGLVFFEKFNAYPDGSGGTMTTRQEHYEGVQVQNSWVNCRVIEVGSFTIKKINSTKMLATYQASQITTSTSKPACLANFTGARETFVFYLTK